MKTKIEHCKHFDPNTFCLSDGCGYCKSIGGLIMSDKRSFNIVAGCMNVNKKTKCPYYED